jgi:hypothetical protein
MILVNTNHPYLRVGHHTGGEVRILTITKALTGTRPTAYRGHRMSADKVREIVGTSSSIEMLVTGSRLVIKRETDLSASAVTKGTVISTVPTTTGLPGVTRRTEGAMKEESRLSTMT